MKLFRYCFLTVHQPVAPCEVGSLQALATAGGPQEHHPGGVGGHRATQGAEELVHWKEERNQT